MLTSCSRLPGWTLHGNLIAAQCSGTLIPGQARLAGWRDGASDLTTRPWVAKRLAFACWSNHSSQTAMWLPLEVAWLAQYLATWLIARVEGSRPPGVHCITWSPMGERCLYGPGHRQHLAFTCRPDLLHQRDRGSTLKTPDNLECSRSPVLVKPPSPDSLQIPDCSLAQNR